MEFIKFSCNWNNKLDCKAFTTLRLRNDNKYKVGFNYAIMLKEEMKGEALIADIRNIKINTINEFIARIDTGYNKDECIGIIKKMYPNVDWNTQELSLILLVKNK